MYKHFFKRLLDVFLSLTALLVLSPILLLLAAIIAIAFRENPIFFQARPGRHEKIFKVIKLKTMNSKRDASGELLPDTERLTPLGIAIRKTSMDELPQLINVLLGEMSLIGPRPLLIRYQPYYTETERRRFEVRPGISGLAQVSGRNFITWEDRFAKDVEYVDNISFLLDLKIIFMTILKVIKSDGIDVDPAASKEYPALDEERMNLDRFKHISSLHN